MRPLRELDDDYFQAARQYAEIATPVETFVRLLNYKGKLDDIVAKDLKAGEIAQRVLGNAADRPMQTINDILEVAGKYGYKSDDNIYNQIIFSDLIEKAFGITQPRSLAGGVARGVEAGIGTLGAATDIATGNYASFLARGFKYLLGKTTDDQLRALRELLGDVPVQKAKGAATHKTAGKFERAVGLGTKDRKVEDAAFAMIDQDERGLLDTVAREKGKIVNADDFRPLFKPAGYIGSNAAAVQEPSSYLSKKAFTNGLTNPEPYVTFTSGMSGAGKTSALKNNPEYQKILEQ
jgi:hypothetical protein